MHGKQRRNRQKNKYIYIYVNGNNRQTYFAVINEQKYI